MLDQEVEVWKDVEGYEGLYQVSNFGTVKTFEKVVRGRPGRTMRVKAKTLKAFPNNHGYYCVGIWRDGVQRQERVHRLVARHFVYNPEGHRIINHKDGDKRNNRASNLEWCTHQHNVAHARSTGLNNAFGEGHGCAKLREEDVLQIRKMHDVDGIPKRVIGRKFGVTGTLVCKIVRRDLWKHI